MPYWFKFALFLTLLALIAVSGGLFFTESLIDVPQKQLETLRENKIEAAYQNFTSSQFQAATSLDQFRQFIHTYPILTTHQTALFPQRSIIDHMTILKGKLIIDEEHHTPIEYRLIKEEGRWKILSLTLPKGQMQNIGEKKKIITMTKAFFHDLQSDQIEKAYHTYFSDQFHQVTSLKEFKTLIEQTPLLKHKSTTSFHHPLIQKNEATISATLKAGVATLYLKIYYTFSHESWKIAKLRILSPEKSDREKEL